MLPNRFFFSIFTNLLRSSWTSKLAGVRYRDRGQGRLAMVPDDDPKSAKVIKFPSNPTIRMAMALVNKLQKEGRKPKLRQHPPTSDREPEPGPGNDDNGS